MPWTVLGWLVHLLILAAVTSLPPTVLAEPWRTKRGDTIRKRGPEPRVLAAIAPLKILGKRKPPPRNPPGVHDQGLEECSRLNYRSVHQESTPLMAVRTIASRSYHKGSGFGGAVSMRAVALHVLAPRSGPSTGIAPHKVHGTGWAPGQNTHGGRKSHSSLSGDNRFLVCAVGFRVPTGSHLAVKENRDKGTPNLGIVRLRTPYI
ncbi:hypothetical protein BDP55DRAFT_637775 [Colletotrichum godetiae]|uniref:Secreted protein n=1 Tax=Colletotrichum godetiae TaxID=1209918 RepID=A0AAJ0A8M8_9PEZI|nr:uncharacterized protein BDP55DRAFT_637775 [Colletotrichum godetiae]KAK1658551.1 hypothetical protein BDP55DRAFT_637775 [Colletotrichum godetiae]